MYTDVLNSQSNSLKHQLELSKRVQEADLRTAQEDYERKVELSLKEKRYSLSVQREKILDLERLIKEEKDRSSMLKQELSQLNSHIQQEMSSFTEKKNILLEDIKFLKEELHTQKSHIQLLQNELMSLENDYDKSMNYLSEKFETNYSALSSQTANNQSKAKKLETEIEELKRQLKIKDSTGEGDIKILEEALRSTYHTVELQAFSIEKLRTATEESLKEAAQYAKQRKAFEQQEESLAKENESLKETIDKLERKIYGRVSRK